MAAVSCYAVSRWNAANFSFPSAYLPLRTKSMSCLTVKPRTSPMLLRSSIISPYLSPSSFAGVSLGLDLKSGGGIGNPTRKRGGGLVVRAAKYVLCQTKRNRSRKSLARTHGFRIRMSTTKGRQVLKRRREKGRWILCTKSNPRSGKNV